MRKAAEHGLTDVTFASIDSTLLNLPEEILTIQFLFEYPEVIEKAARTRAPHHLAHYLLDVARYFHNYYTKAKQDPRYRVLSDDIDRSRAKLYLLRVIQSVLVDGLQTLNLSAPEEMRSPESSDEVSHP
jgi:arginyl-tRNA synthetase